ncbi:MAG: hypothetical protein K940chlam9_00700 [Chlamydiae bacterium]|nr:hypothetical protein [Chlamydiota bacterium]
MRLLSYLNLLLLGLIGALVALFFFSPQEKEVPNFSPLVVTQTLPKSPFEQPAEAYQEVGTGPFSLNWAPPQMLLPDLREELLFQGKNGRPDLSVGQAVVHITLKSSGEGRSIAEGERIYLVYKGNFVKNEVAPHSQVSSSRMAPLWGEVTRTSERGHYLFSSDNQPTPLWLEVHALDEKTIEVRVDMIDERGAYVTSPSDVRVFPLQVTNVARGQAAGWDLGGYRVDSTLLVRQKARWMGKDCFLEMHGGDEYAFVEGRERIDFLDGESPYSCFVKKGDFLIWKEGRWAFSSASERTESYPLMVVSRVDEKVMGLEVWDTEGKGKVTLSLIRARDHHGLPDLSQEFKFVGAKTWAQFIVESRNGGRLTLKPHDWLVLTQEGWKKLESPEQIDDYVEQKIVGPLFVLEKLTKQNGRQVLVGHLFNSSRTEMEEVELVASSNQSLANHYRNIPVTPPILPNSVALENEEDR